MPASIRIRAPQHAMPTAKHTHTHRQTNTQTHTQVVDDLPCSHRQVVACPPQSGCVAAPISVTRAHAPHEPPMCLRVAAPLLPGPTAAHSAQYLPRRADLHVFSAYLLELCYHLRSSPVLCRRVPCLPCGRGEWRGAEQAAGSHCAAVMEGAGWLVLSRAQTPPK